MEYVSTKEHPRTALPPFLEGVRLQPDDDNACVPLGVGLLRAGQREDAQEAFEKALQRDPFNAAAKANLALAANAFQPFQIERREKPAGIQSRNSEKRVSLPRVRIPETEFPFVTPGLL